MTRKYANVKKIGNRVFVREIENERNLDRKLGFEPTLYVKTTKPSDYQSIFGDNLLPKKFEDINSAKDFLKKYEDVENFRIYGSPRFETQWISENYPGHLDFDMSGIKILSLDIETETKYGFPDPEHANERISLITIKDFTSREAYTFGLGPFHGYDLLEEHVKDHKKWTYIECESEEQLLRDFLTTWKDYAAHIVTGWNIQFFDIPYMVQRITKVLGEDYANMLSPWNLIWRRDVSINGTEQITFDIYGLDVVDYLDAFKKFAHEETPENYKLDTVAGMVLKRQKLENPYPTFKDFYEKDWDRFVVYNVVDTDLIVDMDDKKRLLELIVSLAYTAKCGFSDVFSAVALWESKLYNHLIEQKRMFPVKQHKERTYIDGAYVKEIGPSSYDWLVSFDATSLYPFIIMQYNMSPETLHPVNFATVNVQSMLDWTADLTGAIDQQVAVAANGWAFSHTQRGVIPELLDQMFQDRKAAKNVMLSAKQEIEALKKAGTLTETERVRLENVVARNKSREQSLKIALNSCYGCLAQPGFVGYDTRLAEGVTLTGQYVIQQVSRDVDAYLNKVVGTEGKEYVIYIDTDSTYVTLKALVDKFFPNKSVPETVDLIDTICKDQLTKVYDKSCARIAARTNAYQNLLSFKREAIADRGIWTGKKRYALTVYDNEGVRYAEPELKVTGLDSKRATTPKIVRDMYNKVLRLCLNGTEEQLRSYVNEVRETVFSSPIESLSIAKSANNLAKYSRSDGGYTKGCPIQVRSAILHNQVVREKGLEKVVPIIKEGEKIKYVYLHMPNPLRENVVGFIGSLPQEFGLHQYVDYETMLDKIFLKPIENLLLAMKWSLEDVISLDDL